jgi:hypothetical protein
MNLNILAEKLIQRGWAVQGPGEFLSYRFDLLAARNPLITTWTLAVKHMARLDSGSSASAQGAFQQMSAKAKSIIWGKCFVLLLVCDSIAPEALGMLQSDTFGLGGLVRIEGGGGRIIIADSSTGQILGKVPSLPLDANTVVKSIFDAVAATYTSSAPVPAAS